MNKAIAAAALALTLVSSAAIAAPLDPKAAQFAQAAGLSNRFEIEESKIVLQDSTDPAARAFAADMIRDHGEAQAELDRAGRLVGVTTEIMFGPDYQKRIDAIGLMDTPKLDATYLADQQEAHASAVALLGDYAMHGTNPALRAYARASLPVVLHHQRMLETMTGQAALP